MTRLTNWTLAICIATLSLGSLAVAQEESDAPRQRPGARAERGDRGDRGPREFGPRDFGPRGERGPRGQMSPEAVLKDLQSKLDLTEEQVVKIKKILAEQAEKAKALREANQQEFEAIREKIREARQNQDREAMEKIREDMRALMGQGREIGEETRKRINEVLTDEQKAKLHHGRVVETVARTIGTLDLTEEQQAQVDKYVAEAVEKLKKVEPGSGEGREIMGELRKNIAEKVLTEEQRQQLRRNMRERWQNRRDGFERRRPGGEGGEGDRPQRRERRPRGGEGGEEPALPLGE